MIECLVGITGSMENSMQYFIFLKFSGLRLSLIRDQGRDLVRKKISVPSWSSLNYALNGNGVYGGVNNLFCTKILPQIYINQKAHSKFKLKVKSYKIFHMLRFKSYWLSKFNTCLCRCVNFFYFWLNQYFDPKDEVS